MKDMQQIKEAIKREKAKGTDDMDLDIVYSDVFDEKGLKKLSKIFVPRKIKGDLRMVYYKNGTWELIDDDGMFYRDGGVPND